jgi:hypothetical protein
MRFLNLVANKGFSLLFTWLLSQRFTDTLCGTKAMLRSDYLRLKRGRAYFGNFDPFRRLRSHLRSLQAWAQGSRNPGPLCEPHLRRDQHLLFQGRVDAAAHGFVCIHAHQGLVGRAPGKRLFRHFEDLTGRFLWRSGWQNG